MLLPNLSNLSITGGRYDDAQSISDALEELFKGVLVEPEDEFEDTDHGMTANLKNPEVGNVVKTEFFGVGNLLAPGFNAGGELRLVCVQCDVVENLNRRMFAPNKRVVRLALQSSGTDYDNDDFYDELDRIARGGFERPIVFAQESNGRLRMVTKGGLNARQMKKLVVKALKNLMLRAMRVEDTEPESDDDRSR